jgi:hypothetical protein
VFKCEFSGKILRTYKAFTIFLEPSWLWPSSDFVGSTSVITKFPKGNWHFLCYKSVSKPKIHQHCILPRKYNRQRRQLLFLVCLQVSEKVGLWKKTIDSRFGRSSSCFLFSFYYFTQKVWYGNYHLFVQIIILCYVINSTVRCQFLAERWANPKKLNLF